MELEAIWQDYGLDKLETGIQSLFPGWSFSLEEMLGLVMRGDFLQVLSNVSGKWFQSVENQLAGMRNVFVYLLVLGIVSSLVTHFVEIFDRHQVADLSFYFMYLLFTVILFRCFTEAAQTAMTVLENITLFIRLLVPAYLISVGIAAGAATVSVSCQLMILVIYGVESILLEGVLPFVYCFMMLSVVNGIWTEEKLTLLIEFLEKGIGWILKGAVGVITGISIFQSLITPVVDSVRKSGLQKIIAAIPGVGHAAEGAVELVLGSALIIKNSVGVILLLLMLILCAAPLLKIGVIGLVLKTAAGFVSVVSDKRMVNCINRAGDGVLLVLKTSGTAMLLFLISIAVMTLTGR